MDSPWDREELATTERLSLQTRFLPFLRKAGPVHAVFTWELAPPRPGAQAQVRPSSPRARSLPGVEAGGGPQGGGCRAPRRLTPMEAKGFSPGRLTSGSSSVQKLRCPPGKTAPDPQPSQGWWAAPERRAEHLTERRGGAPPFAVRAGETHCPRQTSGLTGRCWAPCWLCVPQIHTQPSIVLERLPPPPPRPCWRKRLFPAPPPRLAPPVADPCVPSGVSGAGPLGRRCRCSGQRSDLESALPPPPAQGRGQGLGRGGAGRGIPVKGARLGPWGRETGERPPPSLSGGPPEASAGRPVPCPRGPCNRVGAG